jgi:hypothetical protein
MADVSCPKCGKLNPEKAETCQYCSAQIIEDHSADWLSDLRELNQFDKRDDLPPVKEKAEDGEVPNWLQKLRSHNEAEETQPIQQENITSIISESSSAESEEQNSPFKLDESAETSVVKIDQSNSQPGGGVKEEPIHPEALQGQPAELPQWLSGLATSRTTPLPVTPIQPFNQENEPTVQAWLNSLESSLQPGSKQEPPPISSQSEALPDWLAEVQSGDKLPTNQSSQTSSPIFSENPSSLPIADQSRPFSDNDLPEWLSRTNLGESLAEEGKESQSSNGKEEELTLAPAELPSWVQAMRPIETATPGSPASLEADEHVEKAGLLAGLRGAISAESLEPEIRKPPAYTVNLLVSEKQRLNATLFENILSSEHNAQALPQKRLFPSRRLLRATIAILLVLVIWVPMLSKSPWMKSPGYLPEEISKVTDAINNLPADATVLVAVDYEPALSGEIEAVAAGVVSQLMSKSANLVLISTNPMGPVLAEKLLSELQGGQPGYSISTKTLNLGYLAGGPSGLYNFAIEPQITTPMTVDHKIAWDQPILKNIKSISDFSDVFVITESADTIRTWVEQVKPAIGQTGLFMITSAQTSPVLEPYYNANQIQGFISGLTGGRTFEESFQLTGSTVSSSKYWDSYQAGLLLTIGLLIIGGLFVINDVLFSQQKSREKD